MTYPAEVYEQARDLAYQDGQRAIKAARRLGYVPVKELGDLLQEVREAWAFGLANGYIQPVSAAGTTPMKESK